MKIAIAVNLNNLVPNIFSPKNFHYKLEERIQHKTANYSYASIDHEKLILFDMKGHMPLLPLCCGLCLLTIMAGIPR